MAEKTKSSKPIWHSPAWLTAIVGVVSAFLTIPQVVSSYLTEQQAIELAKEQTAAQKLVNEGSKQDQELNILRETLSQPAGPERIFVLRYLAKTLDDESAQKWAAEEVARLDEIAQLEQNLAEKTTELETVTRSLIAENGNAGIGTSSAENIDEKVVALRTQLDETSAELQRLSKQSGFVDQSGEPQTQSRRVLSQIIVVATNDIPTEALRDYSTRTLGWDDIGENFIVRRDGQIDIARPLNQTPAVATGHNIGSVGIGVACDVASVRRSSGKCELSSLQYAALRNIVTELALENGIRDDRIFGYHELRGYESRYDYLGDLVKELRADVDAQLPARR